MKRKDMVELIETILSHSHPIDYSEMNQVADNILGWIESKGMLPPIEPGRTVYDLDLGLPEWELEESITNEELLTLGVCPCGSESSVGCSVTGCPLYIEERY